jgi:hypothetical protein
VNRSGAAARERPLPVPLRVAARQAREHGDPGAQCAVRSARARFRVVEQAGRGVGRSNVG